jgi:hypothetical protein
LGKIAGPPADRMTGLAEKVLENGPDDQPTDVEVAEETEVLVGAHQLDREAFDDRQGDDRSPPWRAGGELTSCRWS